ncbi:N-acetylmuramoyl-L-alanine amidase [Paenibacillus methanolicus]|nr:N-acetylmuramoyl-L-alanine amidase [Paenibacillus methanolicus]
MQINGFNVRVATVDPRQDEVYAAYQPGARVRDIAKATGADLALNFNFADIKTGAPIGRLVVDGKTVVSDIPKTLPREELYMRTDGSLQIGKAPRTARWAVQGSPVLRRAGKNVIRDTIERDQLGEDIWQRKAIRTAVGITEAGHLVMVTTVDAVSLDDLGKIMDELGCPDALNGDGGGSTYLWPEDQGAGRLLGSAICVKKKGDIGMGKLVAICDGHGMETPGKRTPAFADGAVMKENEFNRAVAAKLDAHLKRCGFRTLLVAPADADTPLQARTDAANKAKADLYISIHANAAGEAWGSARGIETFHYPTSAASKRVAEVLHRHLIAGTQLPNRGVKTADYHVLRETNMPAVLVEAGFMTNQDDARLLLSESYRNECAEELARGICEYFGVAFKREETKPSLPSGSVIARGKIVESKQIDGVTYVAARAISEAFGATLSWDAKTNIVNID